MRFGIVRAKEKRLDVFETAGDGDDITPAYAAAGLERGKVDHGSLGGIRAGRGLGYVVYEHALLCPAAEQSFFAIGRNLSAGNAVLYGVAEGGATRDFNDMDVAFVKGFLRFFSSVDEIEQAIAKREVIRPEVATTNAGTGERTVLWRWPAP